MIKTRFTCREQKVAFHIWAGGLVLGFIAVISPGPITTPLGWFGGVMYLFGGCLVVLLDGSWKK